MSEVGHRKYDKIGRVLAKRLTDLNEPLDADGGLLAVNVHLGRFSGATDSEARQRHFATAFRALLVVASRNGWTFDGSRPAMEYRHWLPHLQMTGEAGNWVASNMWLFARVSRLYLKITDPPPEPHKPLWYDYACLVTAFEDFARIWGYKLLTESVVKEDWLTVKHWL